MKSNKEIQYNPSSTVQHSNYKDLKIVMEKPIKVQPSG